MRATGRIRAAAIAAAEVRQSAGGGGTDTPASVWMTGFKAPSGLYCRYSTVTARRPTAPPCARLVWRLFENGVGQETVDLDALGVVRIGDLHARLQATSPFAEQTRQVRFEISTDKLALLAGENLPSSADEMEVFFQAEGR